jgi:hypothetical protein
MYSQEWEPESGMPVHCPICSSALGSLELTNSIGNDAE